MRSWTAIVAAATAAFAAPLAVAASSTTPMVSSLRTLPPPPKLPADYVRAVDRSAAYVGITRAAAVTRTRLLLSDVTGLPLYAFAGTRGRVCFILLMNLDDRGQRTRLLIHDRDAKFSRAFDTVFRSDGITVIRTPVRAPNANAYIERWVGTFRRECLDRLLIFNRRQLERILRVYVCHYG